MQSARTKLAGVSRLLAAARANLHDSPGVFVEQTLGMLEGTSRRIRLTWGEGVCSR